MKISTSTNAVTSKIGDEAGIRLFAEAGFECLDFGMFYAKDDFRIKMSDTAFKEYFTHLREVAEDSGTSIFQTHSPMTDYLYTGDEEPGDPYLDLQIKAIRATALLGAPYIVIHPVILPQCRYDAYHEECMEINRKYYGKLRPFAEEYGVKIAVENMFNWDPEQKRICPTVCSTAREMLAYVDMMGRDCFTTCLDIGHAVLTGDKPDAMIREIGDDLGILHVHDNDGVSDHHQAPHLGIIDWDKVLLALKETGYRNSFNFEADTFYRTFGKELFSQSASMLYAIGAELVSRFSL